MVQGSGRERLPGVGFHFAFGGWGWVGGLGCDISRLGSFLDSKRSCRQFLMQELQKTRGSNSNPMLQNALS